VAKRFSCQRVCGGRWGFETYRKDGGNGGLRGIKKKKCSKAFKGKKRSFKGTPAKGHEPASRRGQLLPTRKEIVRPGNPNGWVEAGERPCGESYEKRVKRALESNSKCW